MKVWQPEGMSLQLGAATDFFRSTFHYGQDIIPFPHRVKFPGLTNITNHLGVFGKSQIESPLKHWSIWGVFGC